jgi:hypothetical protein
MIAIYQALGRMRKSQGFSLYVSGDLVRGSHYIVTTEKVLLGVMSCFEDPTQMHLDLLSESYMGTMNLLGFDWLEFELRSAGFNITKRDDYDASVDMSDYS